MRKEVLATARYSLRSNQDIFTVNIDTQYEVVSSRFGYRALWVELFVPCCVLKNVTKQERVSSLLVRIS